MEANIGGCQANLLGDGSRVLKGLMVILWVGAKSEAGVCGASI